MRKVELRMKEKEKYDVIKDLVDHNGNKNRASKKLGISKRQIDRLIIIYKEKGKSGFVHGNRGHIPTKALDKSISESIILLYKNKYYDFNFNHFKTNFQAMGNGLFCLQFVQFLDALLLFLFQKDLQHRLFEKTNRYIFIRMHGIFISIFPPR